MPDETNATSQIGARCGAMGHLGRCILTSGHDAGIAHLYPTPATPVTTVGAVPPEVVNAIIRDPDSPLYPSQIGVYCDDCGATVKADYLVSTDMTKAERLEVARKHLRAQGWGCDEFGDVCPSCERPPAAAVLAEVAAERLRQDATWGEQNHPDGTGGINQVLAADAVRRGVQRAAAEGRQNWVNVLGEEVAEAFAESDPERLRAELVQVAAVAVAWIQAIDRRTTAAAEPERS